MATKRKATQNNQNNYSNHLKKKRLKKRSLNNNTNTDDQTTDEETDNHNNHNNHRSHIKAKRANFVKQEQQPDTAVKTEDETSDSSAVPSLESSTAAASSRVSKPIKREPKVKREVGVKQEAASSDNEPTAATTSTTKSTTTGRVLRRSERKRTHLTATTSTSAATRRRAPLVKKQTSDSCDTSDSDSDTGGESKSATSSSSSSSSSSSKHSEKKKMRAARAGAWVFRPVTATTERKLAITPPRPIPKNAIKAVKALRSLQGMRLLLEYSSPLADYKPGATIRATNKMQDDYEYVLRAPPGQEFPEGFNPVLTPAEMLKMGVFEGHYLNDCMLEFPREWYEAALDGDKLRPTAPDIKVNAFEAKSRQPLQEWQRKGWIAADSPDNRGWFQWYCRYWIGRRCDDDERQIRRWRAFKRHDAQIRIHCQPGEITSRRRQRQGLVQWSYDGFI